MHWTRELAMIVRFNDTRLPWQEPLGVPPRVTRMQRLRGLLDECPALLSQAAVDELRADSLAMAAASR